MTSGHDANEAEAEGTDVMCKLTYKEDDQALTLDRLHQRRRVWLLQLYSLRSPDRSPSSTDTRTISDGRTPWAIIPPAAECAHGR